MSNYDVYQGNIYKREMVLFLSYNWLISGHYFQNVNQKGCNKQPTKPFKMPFNAL